MMGRLIVAVLALALLTGAAPDNAGYEALSERAAASLQAGDGDAAVGLWTDAILALERKSSANDPRIAADCISWLKRIERYGVLTAETRKFVIFCSAKALKIIRAKKPLDDNRLLEALLFAGRAKLFNHLYKEAEVFLEEAQQLSKKNGIQINSENKLIIAIVYFNAWKYERALETINELVKEYENVPGQELPYAERRIIKAVFLRGAGKIVDAEELLRTVAEEPAFKSFPSRTRAFLYTHLGTTQLEVLQLTEARENLERAKLAYAEGPENADAALRDGIRVNLGFLKAISDQEREGIADIKDAMQSMRARGEEKSRGFVGGLIYLGVIYGNIDQSVEAEKHYLAALEILKESMPEGAPERVVVELALAKIWSRGGRLKESIALKQRALTASDALTGKNSAIALYLLSDIGNDLRKQKDYVQSETYLKEALARAPSVIATDSPFYGSLLQELADLYEDMDRKAEAVDLLVRATALYDGKTPVGSFGLDEILTMLARIQLSLGRVDQAEATYARSIALQRARASGGREPDIEYELRELGTIYRIKKDWAKAAIALRESCAQKARQIDAAEGRERAERKYGDRESGVQDSEYYCNTLLADTLWMLTKADGKLDRPRLDEAFRALQLSNSALTASAFARNSASLSLRRSGAEALMDEWLDLRKALRIQQDQAAKALETASSDTSRIEQNYRVEADRLNGRISAIEREIAQKAPDFFDLLKPQAVSLDALQGTKGIAPLLREDEALIVLSPDRWNLKPIGGIPAPGSTWGQVFVVTRNRTAWAPLPMAPGPNEPQPDAKAVRASAETGLNVPRGVNAVIDTKKLPAFDRKGAYAIYRQLFASDPAIKSILSDRKIKSWILVPQGEFVSVPFNILPMEEPQGSDSDRDALLATKWLGWERALQIAPSVSNVAIARQNKKASIAETNEFLGFGDPDFSRSGQSRAECPPFSPNDRSARLAPLQSYFRGGNVNIDAVRALPRLPGTCREIKAMAKSLNAPENNVVLGLDATVKAIASHPRLSSATTVSFATHGLISGDLTGLAQPALAFTPPAPGQPVAEQNDGLLTASEAAALPLNADWVLLSACNTGASEDGQGEGLTGLGRAFLFAGARALLVSHWPVDDEAGAALTVATVRTMQGSKQGTRAEAFRKALKQVANDPGSAEFAHPGFWGPYFLVAAE